MAAKHASGSTLSVVAALIGNILVAGTKLVAALFTGSSAMLSEAVHSIVDTGNELLLLHGIRTAARRPDPIHPLGYGRELYFWSFIVAMLLFGLGAGVSIWEGVRHIADPHPIEDAKVNYIVLGLCFLFEGGSWIVARRQFARAQGRMGFWKAFRTSKDPPSFMVLFEDSAALIGIVIAAIGIRLSEHHGLLKADGIASVAIGLILAITATLLAVESKSLLIGERASPERVASILAIARAMPGVRTANGVITVHLSPDQILAALSLAFDDDLKAPEIEDLVSRIEDALREKHPEIVILFVKPQTPERYVEVWRRRFGTDRASR